MSTETLRRAASKMRERASAAQAVSEDTGCAWYSTTDTRPRAWAEFAGSCEVDAEHIASWSPAVALAVADWLDIMADPHAVGYRGPAVVVAMTYLGTAS